VPHEFEAGHVELHFPIEASHCPVKIAMMTITVIFQGQEDFRIKLYQAELEQRSAATYHQAASKCPARDARVRSWA